MKHLALTFLAVTTILISSCSREKKGCTDPNALNYNAEAEIDNGKCEYPTATKKSLMIFFGGTDCNTCGSFAYPIFNQVISELSTANVIPIIAFSTASDSLFSGAAVNLANVYELSGLPDIAVGSANNLLTKQAVLNAISIENQLAPSVSIAVKSTIDINVFNIEINGKFQVAGEGQYFAAAYILENGVVNAQAGDSDPNFVHNNVLRAASGTSGLGSEITEGTISADFSFKQNYQVLIQPSWNISNLRVVAAIWKKDAQGFHFINAAN